MNRIILTILTGVVLALCLGSTPASAGVSIRIGGPPAVYIATSRPVYYENRATYWHGGRWHYRDGRGWHTYRREPRYLRNHRNQQRRHYYGRGRGRR